MQERLSEWIVLLHTAIRSDSCNGTRAAEPAIKLGGNPSNRVEPRHPFRRRGRKIVAGCVYWGLSTFPKEQCRPSRSFSLSYCCFLSAYYRFTTLAAHRESGWTAKFGDGHRDSRDAPGLQRFRDWECSRCRSAKARLEDLGPAQIGPSAITIAIRASSSVRRQCRP